MAEVTLTDQESLSCSICLDLLNNPVTIPCGHSFCKDCINGLWDQSNDGGVYSCSQCKQTFTQRPSVIECVMLKELAEKLKKMKLQTQTDAEADDVRCDSCTTRRIKAIKSCLTCVSSYCDKHLEQHNELHMGKKHQLIDAADLQSKTCSHHGKLLEYFCCTDQQCICVLCVIDEHKSHDTISAADERAEKQRKLVETNKKFLQKIQDKEKNFKELMKAEESIKHSAQITITESERIFAEVVSSFERTCSRIKELITDKERAGLTHIEGLQKKIQQEIDDMRMKVPELDQFMSTEDHIHFLQNYASCCEEPRFEDPADFSSFSSNSNVFFHKVKMVLCEMQNHFMNVSKETEIKISRGGEPSKIPSFAGGAAHAAETVKLSAAPTVSFGSVFGKKEGQWDCDTCFVRNAATATKCVSCSTEKLKSQDGLAGMFVKKDEQWTCNNCLVVNEGKSSHCITCKALNPDMKSQTFGPASSSFALHFASPVNQFSATGFKSLAGFQFGSSTTQSNVSSTSSPFLYSTPVAPKHI